mmetsp:Transcript_42637/g.166436  ORF Transcript_42637/g.166436 Transcript_42637/m.166436 type:complete len:94 (+) Transcript_42637:1256-1537(+)
MDSIVSALVFAFVRTKSTKDIYVPVINTVKQDLPLRTDVSYLFAKLGLDVNTLTFVDEVISDSRVPNFPMRVTQVLHCLPRSTFKQMEMKNSS